MAVFKNDRNELSAKDQLVKTSIRQVRAYNQDRLNEVHGINMLQVSNYIFQQTYSETLPVVKQ